ncbi:bifunctional [glutamate--ammonia ligase]-adenylyl-L-tyrosine phosphorylase/[glutamate--ammonia-ligase] adenylyltransferase [Corticibacter populi]|uniref:Bifunctional glutamine synthetase adenylyltransferase/adenylyl-removing enzyme n=1 Tax=Corticibacter populi TaxID=1550736 RepID=A0A3M6QRI1_9BURK|nr:bifunctional [glutamate--ammonia ligase]-adenylyl-L-tyrosine phosphorylase/[glutamate--ammonia-ligase] adenylyltransferase [Corticibacter populi]RMX05647.1 bifunctional [glutamate--ammonia ligase]-adenylyl-L-tyrosine phosphorylase/[glutamate--ammonia-ligase] adenylyltransferase [Corticibacter populi]RZS31076.1 glutamate-ammonia-ligase adenylyltransferase [Corticibacter populi]
MSASSAPVPATAPFPGQEGHCQAPADYSRLCQRLRRRYAAELPLLAPGPLDKAAMANTLAALCDQHALGAALRILRQLVLERLVVRDVEQGASVDEITRSMTWLAELALDRACTQGQAMLTEKHGQPQDEQGRPVQFWIIGMGKLGARELNVSSDIDLIYVYEREGETSGNAQGRGRISCQEYFGQLVRIIQTLVGDTTEHGFVFRMDLALRPHGKSGPAAIALSALNDYFFVHGREWERFAWLKSRVVAPAACVASPNVQKLREVVLPFVFRRYLDYAVFDALRDLHRQIREHASVRCAGRPERANDVKISRGGIREIEFTVQLLQVVRGGQFPELRCRPTLEALERLARAGLMPQQTAEQLAEAYRFLRQVEHRIQYLDDQQTHVLPTRDDDLQWIACSMGHADVPHFLRALDLHRERVAQEFDALLGGSKAKTCSGGQCHKNGGRPASFEQLLQQLPAAMAQHVQDWPDLPRFAALRDDSLARVLQILHTTGQRLAKGEISQDAATRFCDWMESLLGRDTYFALLVERPIVHTRILHMMAAARWPLRYMLRHPGVVDELASGSVLHERFDPATFRTEIGLRLESLQRTGEDDEENLMNLLRRGHHAELFRTLARDVEQRISVEAVADDLSALADTILQITTDWCWQRLRKKHREEPQFAIIGYGKLGGKELGYGSDLDIVFVFDDEHDDAPETYAALVRKLITWLTAKTAEGDLYEIDTALRPNGNSGLLVTSFQAYANYQQQRGSNTAWTWEHQAMTRARFVLGSDHLRERFDEVRSAVIQAPRDRAALRQEIRAMRERMRAAHPGHAGQFDVKHSPGGMIDIEFATQYLVLAHSAEHPELVRNAGNIALLQIAEQQGLLPAPVGHSAADAYRALRRIQHIARLNEQPARIPLQEAEPHQLAGLALWQAVFGSDAGNPG